MVLEMFSSGGARATVLPSDIFDLGLTVSFLFHFCSMLGLQIISGFAISEISIIKCLGMKYLMY